MKKWNKPKWKFKKPFGYNKRGNSYYSFIKWFINEIKSKRKNYHFLGSCSKKENGEITTLPNGLSCVWIEPKPFQPRDKWARKLDADKILHTKYYDKEKSNV
jgi:hypothetical protein